MRKITSGQVVELSIFPVGNAAKIRKGRKKGNTPQYKAAQNDRAAVKQFARDLNCNCSHGDLWTTLTYAEEVDRITALRHRDNFLLAVKRAMQKAGRVFWWFAVTSDLDGETGEDARIHHHIIMPRMAYEVINQKWKYGTVDYQILRDQKDYTPLAIYLLKQVRRIPDAKKYTSSRNIKRPRVDNDILVTAPGELKPPRGAKILHRDEYDHESQTQYIRYELPPKKVMSRRRI